MFDTWQDVLVTVVAFSAAVVVVWRTLGHWRSSTPAKPGCDACALRDDKVM